MASTRSGEVAKLLSEMGQGGFIFRDLPSVASRGASFDGRSPAEDPTGGAILEKPLSLADP